MLAVMGLPLSTATVRADRMAFEGRDLLTLSDEERRQVIGRDIAMIFQEPMASSTPASLWASRSRRCWPSIPTRCLGQADPGRSNFTAVGIP